MSNLMVGKNRKEFPQTRELLTIQFRNSKHFVLHEHGLPNPITEEEFFLGSLFKKSQSG